MLDDGKEEKVEGDDEDIKDARDVHDRLAGETRGVEEGNNDILLGHE